MTARAVDPVVSLIEVDDLVHEPWLDGVCPHPRLSSHLNPEPTSSALPSSAMPGDKIIFGGFGAPAPACIHTQTPTTASHHKSFWRVGKSERAAKILRCRHPGSNSILAGIAPASTVWKRFVHFRSARVQAFLGGVQALSLRGAQDAQPRYQSASTGSYAAPQGFVLRSGAAAEPLFSSWSLSSPPSPPTPPVVQHQSCDCLRRGGDDSEPASLSHAVLSGLTTVLTSPS